MDDKELEKRKEEERAKIREVAKAAVAESKKRQKEIDEKAESHLKKAEEALAALQDIAELLGVKPEPKKPDLYVVPPVKKSEDTTEKEE